MNTRAINTIVIIEPNYFLAYGLESFLKKKNSRYRIFVFNQSFSADFLASQLQRLSPELILINPMITGLKKPDYLSDFDSDTKVIAISQQKIRRELLVGFDDLIYWDDTPESILKSIRDLEEFFFLDHNSDLGDQRELSPREKDVVVWVAKGLTNKEIADRLNLSTHTVITHRRNIAKKLQIHSPSGLTIYAIVNNLIAMNDIKM